MTNPTSIPTPSLQVSDDLGAEGALVPENRVTLAQLKDLIDNVEYITPASLPHMVLAVVRLVSGFAVVGVSAPMDFANFDPEKGKTFAFEHGLRQLWPMEAYRRLFDVTSMQAPDIPA